MKFMNKVAMMKPIKPSITLKSSSYLGAELQTKVILLREQGAKLWYEVQLSRLGKTLRYHGLFFSKH